MKFSPITRAALVFGVTCAALAIVSHEIHDAVAQQAHDALSGRDVRLEDGNRHPDRGLRCLGGHGRIGHWPVAACAGYGEVPVSPGRAGSESVNGIGTGW